VRLERSGALLVVPAMVTIVKKLQRGIGIETGDDSGVKEMEI
jgi:hypothetical protein